MSTGVSVIPSDSFASVFPVQGTMTKTSNSFFGPAGSASGIVKIPHSPVIFCTSATKSAAFPKRVSSFAAFSENTGITRQPRAFKSRSVSFSFSCVQKDPVMATPTVFRFSVSIPYSPFFLTSISFSITSASIFAAAFGA